MHLNVSQLLRETSGSRRTLAVDEKVALGDVGPESRFQGTVDLMRTDRGIWVTARLDSDVSCTCGRCLKQYRQPVRVSIEEEFLAKSDARTGTVVTHPVPDGFEDSYIAQDRMLDLSEAVRQYAALATPMKPVCSEGCLGICPTCGASLNEEQCNCDKAPMDARWGPLLELVSTTEDDS